MIKKIFLVISVALLISCGGNSYKSEFELKEELTEKECSRATELISGKLSIKPIFKNLLSSKVKGMKLECVMHNNSAVSTFKDIKAKATFLSKTGTIVFEKEFDVYEFIKPKGQIKYGTEVSVSNQQWNDFKSWNWTIIDASCK